MAAQRVRRMNFKFLVLIDAHWAFRKVAMKYCAAMKWGFTGIPEESHHLYMSKKVGIGNVFIAYLFIMYAFFKLLVLTISYHKPLPTSTVPRCTRQRREFCLKTCKWGPDVAQNVALVGISTSDSKILNSLCNGLEKFPSLPHSCILVL